MVGGKTFTLTYLQNSTESLNALLTGKIKSMTVFHDNVIELNTQCPLCDRLNIHDITISAKSHTGCFTVDFGSMGERDCDECGKTYLVNH